MTGPKPTYQPSVIRLHWLSAALILFLLGLGLWMVDLDLDSPRRLTATRVHVVAGAVCLGLTVARLVSLARSTPPPPLGMSSLHRAGVRVVHVLQYATLIGLLLSGLGLVLLGGLLSLFSITATLPDMSELATRTPHGALAKAFLGLLIVHVGGSVLNQLQSGGTFQRMGFPPKK